MNLRFHRGTPAGRHQEDGSWGTPQHRQERSWSCHLAPRTALLTLFVMVSSALDAFFTLVHLQAGWGEANPFMALVLSQGMTSFVHVKMALTSSGTWLLAACQHFPLALQGLALLALVYAGLLGIHIGLLLT